MDSAFKAAPFSGYTTDELRQMVSKPSSKAREMWAEIDRREAVAAGDLTRATPAERLSAIRAKGA